MLKDFDAAVTWTSFEQHRHRAKTPRARQNLDTVIRHSRAEVEADVDTIMDTLAPDPQYYEYGVVVGGGDSGPKGWDAVRTNYLAMVQNGSYVIESHKDRVFVDDTRLVSEGSFRQVLTADVARSMNHAGADATGYFLLTARTAVFWEFDENGKALGELRYVVPLSIEPLPEEDLPANFPAHLRTTSAAAVA